MSSRREATPKNSDKDPFKRAPKVVRTPPEASTPTTDTQEQAESTDRENISVYLCQICTIEDDIEKICCDVCKLWDHFTCANVNHDVMLQDRWLCVSCSTKRRSIEIAECDLINIEVEKPPEQSNLQAPQAPFVDDLDNKSVSDHSRKANSTTSSMSRRTALALQRLEEERELNAKRDKEYLRQKYVILEDETASNLSVDDQEVDTQKFESVRRWTESIRDPADNIRITINDETQLRNPQLHSTNIKETPIQIGQLGSEDGAVGGIDAGATQSNLANYHAGSLPDWLTNPKPTLKGSTYPWTYWLNKDTETNNTLTADGTLSKGEQRSSVSCRYNTVRQPTVGTQPYNELYASQQRQLSATQPQQLSATQPQQLGASHSQLYASQPQQLSATQPQQLIATQPQQWGASHSQLYASQPQQLSATQPQQLSATQPQQSGASHSQLYASQPQQLSATQPQQLSATQPQQWGASHSQLYASQPQQLSATKTQQLNATQPQQWGASHSQLYASQPQQLSATQPQQLSATQPQQWGASHSQLYASQPQQLSATQTQQLNATQPQQWGASHSQLYASQPQQLSATQPQQLSATQPQQWGASHSQLYASQPEQLSASQTQQLNATQPQQWGASHSQLYASQPEQLSATQTQQLNATQPQQWGASHSQLYASQPQQLSATQPQQLSATQPQQSGASHSQLYANHSQLHASQPQLYTNQPQLSATQPQLYVSQPQLYASRPQQSGASQPQQLHAGQPQQLGVSQPQHLYTSQTQLLGANQQLRLHSVSTNQMYSAGQLFQVSQPSNVNQSFGHSQPATTVSTVHQQPLGVSCHNYIPISQPLNRNHTLNGTNGAVMNPSTSRRLTAEQIASRHTEKDLPTFNGNPREWLSFISAYENATEICGFNDSENLRRLQKCLKGDAYTAVASRLLHKDAVPGIIYTLRIMFGRPELIIETMIQDIHKLPPPKDDDLPTLIKFAIAIDNLSVTIQNLGATEHLRNPTLINSIIDKLPTQHQLNWAFYKQTIGEAHIGHLGKWLSRIAEAATQIVRVTNRPVKKQEAYDNKKKKQDSTKPNPFLNTQVENKSTDRSSNSSETKRICPACSNKRCTKLDDYKKFKDATRDERWTIVKKGNICGRCFGFHKYYRCPSDQKCTVHGCNLNHHALLHKFETTPKATETKSVPAEKENNTCNSQRSKSHQRTDKFRIVPVMLHHKNKSIRDYAYLDDGSNMTTMEDSLADELALKGSTKELCIDWAFGKTHSVVDSREVSVKISGYYDNAPRYNMTNIRTVKHLQLPTQSLTSSWIDQYSHFKNIPIATYESVKPRLLIGLQYSKLIASLETIEGKDDEPIVCKTRLGWVVQGPTFEMDKLTNDPKFRINMCVCQSSDNELHQLVKDYFSIEHLGIKIPENRLESKELQRARNILDTTTVKIGDRYETGLLWKEDTVDLPESYNMALKRLVCLEAKMEKDPKIKTNLHDQIKQFVEKGYIRKLSTDEIKNCKLPVWYLPTFPVLNPKKPEKVRLVWDGAAKVRNTSLNSKLLVGPDELVPLPELLRRFRERKIAITGDIAEMFHQIKIRERDQHAQRFLWREDPSEEPDIYVMMVMTFGSKCSPSTAQYVKNRNAKEFEKEFPRAVDAIIKNHYVDDMIDCTDSANEAETLVKDVKMIHKAGGFNIRNFASNSKELLERIGEQVVSQSKDLDISKELSKERVLGMFWDTASDTFTYSLKFTKINQKMISGEDCPTKREVLRILMSVFDPLGLIANVLVYGKILLQEIWRSKIEWDEKLSTPLHHKWISWIRTLPNVEKLQIPRWYSNKLTPQVQKSIQLHTFVDASVEACPATTYLRIANYDGVDCCLVSSKTKVAPTKQLTVPRLELQAAVIGTRLAEIVKDSQTLIIEKYVFWTDSQTVMAWINSESRRYNQFVSFRVGEILEATDPIQWRWVPTKHNVADEATKSKIITKLDAHARWFKAPAFLYEDEKDWLKPDENFNTEEELRPCFVLSMRKIQQQELIDLNRFSQWNRLLRTQAYVLRFIHNLRSIKQDRTFGLLSQEELTRAENCLYQRAQRDVFLDEILVMKQNETDTKRPIILPRHHCITKLLVDWYHRRYKHINHQTALNEIRQKFVIPALRVVMKGIRASCQKCKNASASPRIPEMAELPPARLAISTRPFTFTGVDYFGPYSVKVNRSVVSKYGVLFTCLTTRAIHLEVADSLNTNSCIDAIIRFSARKGLPREFFSDNGTNFHGTNNELKKEFAELDKDAIQQRFTSSEQKWTFIPPTASHMGGAWERLIETVKNCLKQMLTTKTPSYEMLVTLMAEVENIVNSRPLTYISLEAAEDEALTPNHFLFGSSNALKPIGETTPRDLLRNDWRALQEMTKHFWHRFVLEYLPDLTKRTRWFKRVEPIKVGDVVLNIDERHPRNTWPKGIVDEVIIAKDGCIRQVMVRFEKNTLRRPVSKLAILDVTPPNDEQEVKLNQMGSANGGKDVVQRSNYDNTDPARLSLSTVLPDRLISLTEERERKEGEK